MQLRPVVVASALAAAAVLSACTSGSTTPAASPTDRSSGAPTVARSSIAQSADATPTARVILRPVTAAGDPASGWTTRAESLPIDCSAGTRSPVTVSDGVLYCAPSAAAAIACWRARTAGYAYCLPSATTRTLLRYPVTGASFPAAGPSELEPHPLGLLLEDGTTCSIRDGGAAGRLAAHPDWVPWFFCGKGDVDAAWADPDSVSAGITNGDGASTVALAPSDGSAVPTDTAVRTEHLVGTAPLS